MGLSDKNEKKRCNRSRIARFILKEGATSKPEIASVLKISMPTVLQNVKELMEAGIVEEIGEYGSTGGRKAKALSIVSDNRYAMGIDITADHVSFVVIDLKGDVVHWKRRRQTFVHSPVYYRQIRADMDTWIRALPIDGAKLLGVGISLPGIIDQASATLVRSHILQIENVSLQTIGQYFDQRPAYENDASSAAMAELRHQDRNAVYLSLSDTVGGAIYMGQTIYEGDHFRSAEFGHVILVPGGETCYCGKKGCVDAYCSAKVLSRHSGDDLGAFFQELSTKRGNTPKLWTVWDKYLDDLAVTISNLRMSFDCDIILGGYVGGYLEPYWADLCDRVASYDPFDQDSSYIHICRYAKEASAVGVALTFVEQYLDTF